MPSTPRPVAQNIMTLGLERKIAKSDSPSSSASKYNPKKGSKNASDAQAAATVKKPKTILSCKCWELKTSSLAVLHSVQLLLTSYREVLALKKPGDKSHSQTVLRRHSVLTDRFTEHPILPNALLVEVPDTLLRYVYQLDKTKTLKQWLDKLAACRREVLGLDMHDGAVPTANAAVKNGLIRTLPRSVGHSPLHAANGTSSPAEQATRVQNFTRSCSLPRNNQHLTRSCVYAHGPGSPEPQYRKIGDSCTNSASNIMPSKSFDSVSTITVSSSSVALARCTQSNKEDESFTTAGDMMQARGYADAISTTCGSDEQIGRCGNLDVADEMVYLTRGGGSACSSACLSRNSSARSSDKSLGSVSAKSLNLSVLRESLEMSCNDGHMPRCSNASRDQLCLTLAERRKGFVRTASDQLDRLLKTHSLREKASKKRLYERVSSSVSELDTMLCDGRVAVDFLHPPGHSSPPRSSGHTPPIPTTPTSPLEYSHVAATSPSLSSLHGEDAVEGFAASRFHHTQIRKQKWKQSPRIQRHVEQQVVERPHSGSGQYGRSFSESPTAGSAHTLHHQTDIR